MLLKTHIKYAIILYNHLQKNNSNIKINKFLFIIGHILPDYFIPKYFFKVHNFNNYLFELKYSLNCILKRKNLSIHLGIVLHLIQDQFCKYHNLKNNIPILLKHAKYEKDFHKYFIVFFDKFKLNKHPLISIDDWLRSKDIIDQIKIIHDEYMQQVLNMDTDFKYSFMACIYLMHLIEIIYQNDEIKQIHLQNILYMI